MRLPVRKADLIYEKPDKNVLNMLKVNFRCASGFFAAGVFVGKKVTFMPDGKNATIFRQYLGNSVL